jgi:D-threo-aldose 1-dehydrogenase
MTIMTSSRHEFLNPGSRYVLPVKFGLGGVPLGNEFEVVSDEDAYKTLEAAWNAGVRYYDVSPWYGLGLAERRYGNFLHNKNRDDYVLSSKVGKLLKQRRQVEFSVLAVSQQRCVRLHG